MGRQGEKGEERKSRGGRTSEETRGESLRWMKAKGVNLFVFFAIGYGFVLHNDNDKVSGTRI